MNANPRGDFQLVVPSRVGKDLQRKDRILDGHIRVERDEGEGRSIFIDLFDSRVEDADKAHITSESFPLSNSGADEATRFLQEYGFRVAVVIK